MSRLFIIGNGFDMFHNMKTSYKNFRDFFEENDTDAFKKFNDLFSSHQEKLWNSLESELGELTYEDDLFEKCSSYLYDYVSDDWGDSDNWDFQYEVDQFLCTLDALKINMEEWIKQMKYPDKPIFNLNNSDNYLTFNYTLTLEKLYSIDNDKIFHIHNKSGESIILGHNNEYCEEMLDHHNPDHFDWRVQESISSYNSYMDKYRKHTDEIIEQNYDYFEKKFDEIVVIGHSMSEVDIKYFRELSKNNRDSKWVIFYHSEEDKTHFLQKALELELTNYSILKDTELVSFLS